MILQSTSRWVSELAAQLRRNGVQIQYLTSGTLIAKDNVTQFMEHGIRASDRVLVICTDSYVTKANDGEDGIGYEPMIVTSRTMLKI